MATLSPVSSHSASKDSIDDRSTQRKTKGHTDDQFEDSLNASISEHISEEIESINSSSAVEDSIEKRFDQLVAEKKRKLFDFDSDKSDAVNNDGNFSKFGLDESLSGDNIAKHFRVEAETSTQRRVNEPVTSASHGTKTDELKIADVDEGAAKPTDVSTSSKANYEMQPAKDSSNSVKSMHQSDAHSKNDDKNDVILINDHEISINSLKELQRQRSRSDVDAANANQNTTSDISDLQNEENAKEQRSIDDLSASINESSAKVEGHSADRSSSMNQSKSQSQSEPKSDSQSEQAEESAKSDEIMQKCKPIEGDSPPELSVIEEVSAAQERSSERVERSSDKKSAIRDIIDEAINKLPLDKENRPPNLSDDLFSVDSKHVTSSQNSTITDGTVYNALTKVPHPSVTLSNFEEELNLNLLRLESRIKEMNSNLGHGKFSIGNIDLPLISSSRRDSRRESLMDLAQSARDSSSLTTNSTEYRTFQDDYFQLTDLQVALVERDKMILELTDNLKKTIEMHDQLNVRNEALVTEVNQLKTMNMRRKWVTDRDPFDEPRLSETTMDLVSGSDFEDDDFFNKGVLLGMPEDDAKNVRVPHPSIEEFKTILNENETAVFARVEEQFEQLLNDKLSEVQGNLQQEQYEKAELESEVTRLQQLVANLKGGSKEVQELRTELGKVHKKEMENLRVYFEKKCGDMEKQYSEEVNSQHSRRHSNDTNSDLSDDEIFLPDETQSGIRRASKTGDILASPTHRKLTPTHIRSAGSSPIKRAGKRNSREFRSLNGSKANDSNFEEIHEHYRSIIADLKQSHEENIKHMKFKLHSLENSPQPDDEYLLTTNTSTEPLAVLTTEKFKTNPEHADMFHNLVNEYDRRLEQQVKLAKLDMLRELELQIQTLLSDPIPDESRWPSELILLREKFTAKSQLEIAQLQIKHEEEMSRIKNDHKKQLDRKIKRHTDFDNGRPLEKSESERDNLRELCNTFRHLLYELAKCVSVCEHDLNASLVDELNKHGILQASPSKKRAGSPSIDNEADLTQSTVGSRLSFVPDVSGILSLIEDPSLINFMTDKNDTESSFNSSASNPFSLNECLEHLKMEADTLLMLSEKIHQKRIADNKEYDDTQKSLEEEDGLKITKEDFNAENIMLKPRLSLPFFSLEKTDMQRKIMSHADLNDLKNRLLLAESKNQELEKKLAETVSERNELTAKLNTYMDSQSEELSEGYGISQLRSPQRHPAHKSVTSFTALQERAKQYFSGNNTSDVSQLLEDFCRECDKHVEEEKEKIKDLQEQIDAAYNQRKSDLEFLEKQAAERESERDEFGKKVEKLESKLRDVEKERLKFDNISKESEVFRQQIQEMEIALNGAKKSNLSLQTDLKDSIDKIYDLREIIVGYEKQIKENDNIMKSLKNDIDNQQNANDTLQLEIKSLLSQSEVAPSYEEKIHELEEQLESLQPNADQSAAMERIAAHLREIEDNLDRKINLLESVHMGTGTVTTCSSPSEDVSVRGSGYNLDSAISPRNFHYLAKDPSFPVDQIMRIIEKMQKHSKVEEAAVKLVRDLEMQIKALHTSYMELQNERELLKEKMEEQLMRITSIQSRLDEQRQRAEELQRAGTSDLNLKVYDLQAEIKALKETVSSRDKQIGVLKSHLAQSKEIIDKQEAEIATYNCISDGTDTYSKVFVEKLEARIAAKEQENKNLREKMRTEMITKVALPDLMETMLADKTDEIDYLKEQLDSREKELKSLQNSQIFAKAEEKISDMFARNSIGSDYIDKECLRKMPDSAMNFSLTPAHMENNENTPPLRPRQILFSTNSVNDTNSVPVVPLISTQLSSVTKNDSIDGDDSKSLRDEIEYLKLSIEDKIKLVDDVTAEKKKMKESFVVEKDKLGKEIDALHSQIDELQSKVDTIEAELAMSTKNCDKKCSEFASVQDLLNQERANNNVIKQQLNSMENTISLKDELISKLQMDLKKLNEDELMNLESIKRLQQQNTELANLNGKDTSLVNQELRNELARMKEVLIDTERELYDKMISYEKCLLDIKEQEEQIFKLTDALTDSKSARSVEELRIEISKHREENMLLKKQLDEIKRRMSVQRSIDAADDAGIEEMTSRVEKELNYSAHLDSSILKAAMEGDFDLNQEPFDDIDIIREEKMDLENELKEMRNTLDSEREKYLYIHQQDTHCIETIQARLEVAMETEKELNRLLEEERSKTSKLSTKMLEHQFERAKLSASNLSLNESPISSPRRLIKGGESDQELLKCQNDEIKLLKSQLEREKERASDTEKSLMREKGRFEKQLDEQKAYGDRMRDELERIIRENKTLQEELEDAQEKLTLSMRDIESMQGRIKQLQDAEAYRTARNEKDRTELTQSIATCRELKTKLINLERERDVLQERVSILQADIDRGSQREARLTESLVAGYQQSSVISSGLIPQQLLSKLKEMNDNLSENARENRQLSETLQILTQERHVLQKKVNDLEVVCIDRDELEERASHLFGKYLRAESFRRALVHQKRYLMIMMSTYESNEAKVLLALNNGVPLRRKVPSFKSVVLVAVAIERMKFILRRWQTGKRVCVKNSIFPHNTPPRRTASASTINWSRNDAQIPNPIHHPQSPPIRERPMTSVLKGRRCTNNDFTNQI